MSEFYPEIKFGNRVALQVSLTGTLHFRVDVLDMSVNILLRLEHVWITNTQGVTVIIFETLAALF